MEQYNQQISPDATQATTPEELHPVAAAFGGDIGAALEKGGGEVASRIQTLSLHMARMNYYRGEAQRADLLNQYKTSLQTKLYGDPNDPNATVTSIGGNVLPATGQTKLSAGPSPSNVAPTAAPIEIPAGVYNRKGYAAAGALQDVDAWHQQAAQETLQQAQNLGLRNNSILKMQMDNAWSSERMGIVKHEAQQIDQAQQQTYFKGLQLDADNAVTKQDPVSLGRTIDSINQQNKMLNDSQGKDDNDPIRELTANKFISQALNNSMTTNLRATGGDPTQFQATLDRLHDDGKINDTVYDNASEHLDKTAKGIVAQNQIAVKIQTVNQRMNTMQLALQHKLDLNNPNTSSEISSQDPELGTALSNYNLNKNSNIKDEDEAFADATEKVFSAGSKEQVSKYMTNVLKESKISQDRLNILFGAAMDRGKNLADLEGQSKASNPVQNAIDSGMKYLMSWGKDNGHDAQTYTDFLTAAKSKPPDEAVKEAIGNAAIRKNPAITSIPENGKEMVDKHGNTAIVYPDGHFEEMGAKKQSTDKKEE